LSRRNPYEEYTSALTRDDFLANTRTQDAVIRRLEIIGEAVKSLPADWKDAHPEPTFRSG
jgi:uncharacterized protein with HEPN domain